MDTYLLQVTFGNKATSSIQYVIFTHKEAHDPVKVLEEKTLILSSGEHIRSSWMVNKDKRTCLSVAFNVFVHGVWRGKGEG